MGDTSLRLSIKNTSESTWTVLSCSGIQAPASSSVGPGSTLGAITGSSDTGVKGTIVLSDGAGNTWRIDFDMPVIGPNSFSTALNPNPGPYLSQFIGAQTGWDVSLAAQISQPVARHLFVLVLENHSFDHLFAMSGIPGIDAATGDNTNTWKDKSTPPKDTTVNVARPAPVSMSTDPGHEFADVMEQLCGPGHDGTKGTPYPPINNSGFASNYATTTTEGKPPAASAVGDIMKCFDTKTQLPVSWQLATEFAICDHWFSSLPGPTWPNRYFFHGASSNGLEHSPDGGEIASWEYVDGFRYPKGSIFDALRSRSIPYRLYHDGNNSFSDERGRGCMLGATPQVASLHNIQVSDFEDVTQLAADLKGPYPYAYTFIEPNYGDVTNTYAGGSSQHPMDDVHGGEALIKAVYEAIRNSPIWDQSVLIIAYDEHGGFYDSVPPGKVVAPGDGSSASLNRSGFDFTQLGVRVPAIVVSPWIPRGFVDKTVYDHSSVPATIEKLCGLDPLTLRDAAAKDVLHLLQLNASREDCPTTLADAPAPGPGTTVTAAAAAASDQDPIPQTGSANAYLAVLLKTELEQTATTAADRAQVIANFQKIQTKGHAKAYADYVHGLANAAKVNQ